MFRKMSLWIGILIVFCLPFGQNVSAQTPPPDGTSASALESSVKSAQHAAQPVAQPPSEGSVWSQQQATRHNGQPPSYLPAASTPSSGLNVNSLTPNAALTLGTPGTSFSLENMYGVSEEPYLTDANHLLNPAGLFIDASDNLYVVEEEGYRMLRYNANGSASLVLGRPGISYHGAGNDIAFANPHDVAADAAGNIWVMDDTRLIEFNSAGTYLRQLPAVTPWESGNDNTHFNYANGLAIDNTNQRLFVADTNNNRVQVYDITSGAPVWQATIGSYGSEIGQFDQPYRVVMDDAGQIYVSDSGNGRIQRCALASGTWSCQVFLSTSDGVGLIFPKGLFSTGTDIYIGTAVYINNTYKPRVIRCTTGATPSCSTLFDSFFEPSDLAVDSSGNVYLSSTFYDVVAKYTPSGVWLSDAAGTAYTPYFADDLHYNQPHVSVDASDNLLIIERSGQRLTKLDAQGVRQWGFGQPGHDQWFDSTHLASPTAAATDQAGNIYVANSDFVSVLDKDGHFLRFMADGWQQNGVDYWFSWITSIAIDKQNFVYLTDTWNSRIVVFKTDGTFVATIGGPDAGTGSYQFRNPQGLAVDSANNLYVADTDNCRIQKFNSSRVYVATFGVTGDCSDAYSDVPSPTGIAVDSLGRIYTTGWEDRIRVFNASGGLLTILGSWFGGDPEATRGTQTIAVDSKFNIYLGDGGNGRVKKYAPAPFGWRQINLNGFDRFSNEAPTALEQFNGQLYSASYNYAMGARIWRLGSTGWEPVSSYRFGKAGADVNGQHVNVAVIDMILYGGKLYASTGWGDNPGEIWSSPDGTTWTQETGNFTASNNSGIYTFTIYNNMLLVSSYNKVDGAEIWRKASPQAAWDTTPIYKASDIRDLAVLDFKAFGSYLYAGVENTAVGMKVMRSQNGSTWEDTSFIAGNGDPDNVYSAGMAVFNGYLYMGTVHRGYTGTGELWRTTNGSAWEEVTPANPLGTGGAGPLIASNGSLYFFMDSEEGVRVLASRNGSTWKQVNVNGFGTFTNFDTPLANNAVLEYHNAVTAGIWNYRSGGSIWQMVPGTYLPVVTRPK